MVEEPSAVNRSIRLVKSLPMLFMKVAIQFTFILLGGSLMLASTSKHLDHSLIERFYGSLFNRDLIFIDSIVSLLFLCIGLSELIFKLRRP